VEPHIASACAPASIGNVAAGFDCLGLAFGAVWDEVTAHRVKGPPQASLGSVSGLVSTLPTQIERNTALRAAQAVLDTYKADFGVRLDVIKGIPMSAGMGGSAASSVAGALAVNALLQVPLSQDALFCCAMQGEAASADPPPPDNVAAALYGGLVLIGDGAPQSLTAIPLPKGLVCLLFHPSLTVKTEAARGMLSPKVALPVAVAQMRHVGGLIAGCFTHDLALIAQNLRDGLIEPQRAALVPPFAAVKAAAIDAGALGCSLSGSGPSVFAWVQTQKADAVQSAMATAFAKANCKADAYKQTLKPCRAEVMR
jgi:homoserine kinase